MDIYSKQLLHYSHAKSASLAEIICELKFELYNFSYKMLKRGSDFFFIFCGGPDQGTASTSVVKSNFIYKTNDFKNWIGSGIGSGYTTYDEQADAFFSVTLGLNYSTNMAAYHITKINPDDFSYVTTTIMSDTPLSQTSRGITKVQRVGNYLMFLCYKNETQLYSYYSGDMGNSWSNTLISTISSFGLGTFGHPSASNGSSLVSRVYFGSTTSSMRYFTSPTNSFSTNTACLTSNKPLYTSGDKFLNYKTNQDLLSVSTDGIKDNQYPIIKGTSSADGVFFQNYYISNATTSSKTQLNHFGKIVIQDLDTAKMYVFDPKIDEICYSSGSEPYKYYYSYIKILDLIDNDLYFTYQNQNSRTFLARMPINDVIEQKELYTE